MTEIAGVPDQNVVKHARNQEHAHAGEKTPVLSLSSTCSCGSLPPSPAGRVCPGRTACRLLPHPPSHLGIPYSVRPAPDQESGLQKSKCQLAENATNMSNKTETTEARKQKIEQRADRRVVKSTPRLDAAITRHSLWGLKRPPKAFV